MDTVTARTVYTLPDQTVSSKVKLGKDWGINSLEYWLNNIHNSNNRRKTFAEIVNNRDYLNSVMSYDVLKKSLDPLGVVKDSEMIDYPYTFYNMIEQPFNTLFGEELKRRADAKAFVVNQNAINLKDEEFRNRLSKFMTEQAQKKSINEEEFNGELEKIAKWAKNDLQTSHEQMANQILTAILNDSEINYKEKTNKGFIDLECIAEEIYRIGHEGKDPQLYNVNGEHFYVFGLGESLHIEEGNAWVEIQWLGINTIINEFGEELTKAEIDELYKIQQAGPLQLIPNMASSPLETRDLVDQGKWREISEYITVNDFDDFSIIDNNRMTNSSYVDSNRNVRVVRVQFLTLLKVGKLTYYDDNDKQQYTFVDENYIPDTSKGEEIEWIYCNELWEGTKLGRDKYLRIRPHPIQMRSLNNPAKVKPTYVGIIKAYPGGKAKSRLDIVKSYQDDFNIWMNKLKDLWTKNLGKIPVIDMSRIPSDMPKDEWYLWLKRIGLMWENPFEESKKRPDLIAGNMQQNNRVLDLSLATEINQAIQMLSWIEQMINKVTAIPEARQGQTESNAGLGISQQNILQSSNQTELDFTLHDYVKAKILEVMLEYTKVLWKDDYGKRQYLLSNLSNYIIDIDGPLFNEADYGVRVTNTSRGAEIDTIMKNSIHAAMQNGMTLSDVTEALLEESPSARLIMLKESEDKRNKQQQEMQKQQLEQQSQMQQQQLAFEERKHQMELEKLNVQFQWQMKLKEMDLNYKQNETMFNQEASDTNGNFINDEVDMDIAVMQNETKNKEIDVNEKLKREELALKEKIELKKVDASLQSARLTKKSKSNN